METQVCKGMGLEDDGNSIQRKVLNVMWTCGFEANDYPIMWTRNSGKLSGRVLEPVNLQYPILVFNRMGFKSSRTYRPNLQVLPYHYGNVMVRTKRLG